MPTPEFIIDLREKIGHLPLWLSGATAVVVREGAEGAEVLLVRRSDNGRWAPVSGIVDPGEDPHLTAVREVMEEASVTCEVERLVWMSVTDMVVYDNGDQSRYLDHAFRCRYVAGDPRPGDEEATEARFFSANALPEMAAHHAETVRIALEDRPEPVLGGWPPANG